MITKLKSYFTAIYAKNAYLIVFLAVVSILAELCFFNASRLYLSSSYPYNRVNLPYNEQLKTNAAVISKDNPNITINGLDLNLNNVAFKTAGPMMYLEGSVYFTGENFRYANQKASHFAYNPGSEEFSYVLTKVRGRGKVNSVTISFENLGPAVIAVTSIELNKEPDLHFYFLRAAIVFMLLGALAFSCKYKLYKTDFDFKIRAHRYSYFAVVALALFCSLAISRAYLGEGACPVTYTYYANAGSFPMVGGEHQYLTHMPRNQQEVVQSDYYVRLMDAFSKGQLYIDYDVDPAFKTMDDPWDYTERMAKKVFGIYDVVYANDHYYIYTGLCPLIFYYPIYFLTGQPPFPPLVMGIISVLMIMSFALLYPKAMSTFNVKTSVVFYLSGFATLVTAGCTYYYLVHPGHGTMPYLTSILFSCLGLYCLFSCINLPSAFKRRALLLGGGLCIVLIVTSRPADLAIPLFIGLGLLPCYLKDPVNAGFKTKLLDFISIAVPTLAGAVFVMWYNYARFGSIFEFGHFLQITYNHNGIPLPFDLQNISNFLYHVYLEPPTYLKDFPFLGQTILEHTGYANYGTFLYALIDGMGLLNFSIVFAFALLFFKPLFCDQDPQKRAFYISSLLVIIISLALSYITFRSTGFAARYYYEQLYVLILFSVMIASTYIRWDGTLSSRVCYMIVLCAMAKSFVLGFLVTFKDRTLFQANPDFYLYLRDLFSPFTF